MANELLSADQIIALAKELPEWALSKGKLKIKEGMRLANKSDLQTRNVQQGHSGSGMGNGMGGGSGKKKKKFHKKKFQSQ